MTGSQTDRPDSSYSAARLATASLSSAAPEPNILPGVDYYQMPRRMVRYVEVSAHGLESVVEGHATDLDSVLAWVRGVGPDRNTGHDTYDLVVFRGERVVAIITRGDNRWPLVRLVEPAVGPEAAPEGDDSDD